MVLSIVSYGVGPAHARLFVGCTCTGHNHAAFYFRSIYVRNPSVSHLSPWCVGVPLWLYASEIYLMYKTGGFTGTSNGIRAVVDLRRMEKQESEGNRAVLDDSVEDVKLKGVNKSTET